MYIYILKFINKKVRTNSNNSLVLGMVIMIVLIVIMAIVVIVTTSLRKTQRPFQQHLRTAQRLLHNHNWFNSIHSKSSEYTSI